MDERDYFHLPTLHHSIHHPAPHPIKIQTGALTGATSERKRTRSGRKS